MCVSEMCAGDEFFGFGKSVVEDILEKISRKHGMPTSGCYPL